MATRQELIKQAESKFQRDQLVQAAQAKWQSENMPQAEPEPALSEQIETAGRSVLEGMTFGASEPAISGVNAVIGNLISSGFDAEGLKDFFNKSVDSARIQAEFKRDVERRRKLEQELPGIAAASEIAGAVLPAFATGGTTAAAKLAVAPTQAVSALGKGAVAAAERLAAPAIEAVGLAGKAPTLTKAARGVGQAVATGVAAEAVKQAAEVPTGFITPEERLELGDVAEGAALISGTMEALPLVGKAIKAGGAKALSAVGGVREKTIKEYLKRSEPLLPVSTEVLKDQVDNALARVQAGLVEQRKQGADDLLVAVKALKDKIIEGSKESYDILEREGIDTAKKGAEKLIKASSINDEINRQIAAQKTKTGDILLNPLRESVANKLQDFQGRLNLLVDQVGENLDLGTAKNLIQSLDEITDFAVAEGQFSTRLDQSLKAIRSSINKQLRQLSPAYASKMDEVSKDAKLLDAASQLFGTEQAALGNLQTLAVGKNPRVNELASQLEQATGVKISRGIEAIKKTIPVERMDPKTTQSFLKGVMSDRSIEGKRTLKLLSELADEDLVKLADEAAMTAEFEKVVQNGSRDVNFWKEVLGGLTAGGALAGTAVGGPMGGVVGAGIGYMVKTFGAPATKKILDGMITVRGIPSVQKLNQALSEVDPKTRQNLINGFIRANTVGMEADEPKVIKFEPQAAEAAIQDFKSSGLDSVTKAKAMKSLQQSQTVDTTIMKRFMVGEQPKASPAIPMPKAESEAVKEDRPDMLKALDQVEE
jgi:hypothetical protein